MFSARHLRPCTFDPAGAMPSPPSVAFVLKWIYWLRIFQWIRFWEWVRGETTFDRVNRKSTESKFSLPTWLCVLIAQYFRLVIWEREYLQWPFSIQHQRQPQNNHGSAYLSFQTFLSKEFPDIAIVKSFVYSWILSIQSKMCSMKARSSYLPERLFEDHLKCCFLCVCS